jgi:hypothetical protein
MKIQNKILVLLANQSEYSGSGGSAFPSPNDFAEGPQK